MAVQDEAAIAVRAEPADDDRAPGVRPGADARHRIELDAVRERDPLDRHADPLELGGEHVLGTLLGARHARLAHERLEEGECPLGAVVDCAVDGPLDGMVFRLGHFAETITALERRGREARLFGYRSGAIRRLFSTASARPRTARDGCGPKTAHA